MKSPVRPAWLRNWEMTVLTLRARYVFPATGDLIPDGTVSIDGDRIVSVGPWGAGVPPAMKYPDSPAPARHAGETPALQASHETRDLGNVAILPGLVNAHVHLDFSGLSAPLGQRGIGLVDWIRLAMGYRRQTAGPDRHPVALGLAESLCSGVTTLGEIAQPDWPLDAIAASPPGVTVFQELIAPTVDRVAAAVELARSHLTTGPLTLWERGETSCLGLSPHAPYSVHFDLLRAAVELSRDKKIPLAMHLAESREESELLRSGSGPFRTLLEELGAWDATAIRPQSRPLDYLRHLALAHRALVIHGNYLDDEEIAFLGAHREQMAVVYCPRTHDWFAHNAYPLEKMLAAGATVALGTDGRGSSPDLSLLAEMRFAAQRHPAIGLDKILRMGTIDGARALGRDEEIGSIAPGKQADLAIVALPDRATADPYQLLFDSTEPVVACYCRGVEIDDNKRP